MINDKLREFCLEVGKNFFSNDRKLIDKEKFSLVIDKFFQLQVAYDFILDTCYFYYMPLLENIKKNHNVQFISIDLLEKYFDYDDISILCELFHGFPIDINHRLRYECFDEIMIKEIVK